MRPASFAFLCRQTSSFTLMFLLRRRAPGAGLQVARLRLAPRRQAASRRPPARAASLVAPLRERDVVEGQLFLVQDGLLALALVLPGGHVTEGGVVTHRLAFGGLVLLAVVAAARLLALERVHAGELAELEEVGHAPGLLQRRVQLFAGAQDRDVLPELLAQGGDHLQGFGQARLAPGHPALLPQQLAELAMEAVDRALPLDREQLV